MKLLFKGHDYKYAVEQMMITLFPDERPEYVDSPRELGDNSAVITLSGSEKFITATAILRCAGGKFKGICRERAREFPDSTARERELTYMVKTAFFKAACSATGMKPLWGSLTGIRPGKIATALMNGGCSPQKAIREMGRRYYVSPEKSQICVDASIASEKIKNSLDRNDISLYIGIPFCPTRCAYCSFVSNSVEKSMKMIEPYLEALYREIEDAARLVKEIGLKIKTVYYGGGTPTTLNVRQLSGLMEKVEKEFDLSQVEEYTVEAGRPDTVDLEKFREMKGHGVTRVSINPQTMRDDVLKIIGRSHTGDDIRRAYDEARRGGFDLINMDLIAGLPGDDTEGFMGSLDAVLDMAPENVTVHTLALKKGSRLRFEGREHIPSGEEVGKMLEYSRKKLTGDGYSPYYLYRQKFTAGGFENVGWSKKDCECIYNICIMEELHTILALGAGGTTKLVDPDITRIERIFNPKYPNEYIQRIEKIVGNKEYMKEYYDIMRKREGLSE